MVSDDDFPDEVTRQEIAEAVEHLIELGLLEVYGLNENGEVLYDLTDLGRQVRTVQERAEDYSKYWPGNTH